MVITDKKAAIGFIAIVAIITIITLLFTWAKPMTMKDKDDVKDIITLLQEDNATVELISIGDIATYKETDYQLVKYKITKDNVITVKSTMIEVEKHFLNYKSKQVLLP